MVVKVVKGSALKGLLVLIIAGVVFGCPKCHATSSDAPLATTLGSGLANGEPFDMTASMGRMLGGFLFCLGLFGAGIHLYKRYLLPTAKGSSRRLRIVERLSVSQKNALLLVALDGRELLIATGPDSPRLLTAKSRDEFSFDQDLLNAAAIGDEFNA